MAEGFLAPAPADESAIAKKRRGMLDSHGTRESMGVRLQCHYLFIKFITVSASDKSMLPLFHRLWQRSVVPQSTCIILEFLNEIV